MSDYQVAVVGGTHGNEFSGIQLVKQWQRRPEALSRPGLRVESLWAHPHAHEANRRYLDADLNRQFTPALLADPLQRSYEALLAKALDQQLGPKSSPKTDLIIDLHNTTSAMGPTLILLESDAWARQLAAYVKAGMPEAVILLEDSQPASDWGYLCSMAKRGVMVEVGPQPQSVLRQGILDQMATMVGLILDFASAQRLGALPPLPDEVEAFRYVDTRMLPLDEAGRPVAMVAESVDGKDFQPLEPGAAVFTYFDGRTGYLETDRTLYPHFINEAAYYNSHAAFSLAERVVLKLSE
ncbi:aspartoacylase [Ferrimonas gelatinilytica]|uniref:Aspartoacylase n=1 Tax=Ferrimonas gelatinilytica TaxID=1255257 RepID=A0ABP9S085_9GAMM